MISGFTWHYTIVENVEKFYLGHSLILDVSSTSMEAQFPSIEVHSTKTLTLQIAHKKKWNPYELSVLNPSFLRRHNHFIWWTDVKRA